MTSYKECVLIPFSVYEFLRNCEHQSIRDAVSSINIKQLNHFPDTNADKINIRYTDGDKGRGSVNVSRAKPPPHSPSPKKDSIIYQSIGTQTDTLLPRQSKLSTVHLGGESIAPRERELSALHLGGENIAPRDRELSTMHLGGENIAPKQRSALSALHLGGESIAPRERELSTLHLGGENVSQPNDLDLRKSNNNNNNKLFNCSVCGVHFTRLTSKRRHEAKFHPYPLKKQEGNREKENQSKLSHEPAKQMTPKVKLSDLGWKSYLIPLAKHSAGGKLMGRRNHLQNQVGTKTAAGGTFYKTPSLTVNKKGRMGKKRNIVSIKPYNPSPPPVSLSPPPLSISPEMYNTSSNSKAKAGRKGAKRKPRSKLEVMQGILIDNDKIMSNSNKRQLENVGDDDYEEEWDAVKMKKRKLHKQKLE